MSKAALLLILIFIFCSCSKKAGDTGGSVINHNISFPVLTDTLSCVDLNRGEDFYNRSEFSFQDFQVCYIGKESDTLIVNNYYRISKIPLEPNTTIIPNKHRLQYRDRLCDHVLYDSDTNRLTRIQESRCEIRVDTAQILYSEYPVLVRNSDSVRVEIGFESHLFLEIEALDSNGNWQMIISDWNSFQCGLGSHVFLNPGEVALTFIPILRGNYYTSLRVKMGMNYSNTFRGRINYTQFHPDRKQDFLKFKSHQSKIN
ncbi:MAG: hypothetical protein GC181_15885 [Bacteroidetes bacterium]|nr:hypothetical protein [Bacteroidota bacterium]